VGGRAAAGKKRPLSRAEERRTLLIVVVIVLVPTLAAALAIVTSRMGPDLGDLTAVQGLVDGKNVISWPSLSRDRSHALNTDSRLSSGSAACALGYMNSGDRAYREGQWISDFVLLPETGNLLHPAHQFGDQMIAVHLRGDRSIRFSADNMLWACGEFGMVSGDPNGQRPLYFLANAEARSAGRTDIAKYFEEANSP
jgi:hypothetical protein